MIKKTFFPLVIGIASTSLALSQEASFWSYHPLHAGGQFIRLGEADCEPRRVNMKRGTVQFHKTNVFTSMLAPINRENIFIPQLQWNSVFFDWNKNRKFKETQFPYLQATLTYLMTAIEKWRWIMRFDYCVQTDYLSHAGLYSLYNGLIWGSNEINCNWHYHIGAMGCAGLEKGNFYPILGFDYSPNARWLFKSIFPINYSIEYHRSRWTLAAKVRPLKERIRVGPREQASRSIFSYSSVGTELFAHYEKFLKIAIELYGGINWGGSFTLRDKWGNHPEYINVKQSPYFGFSLDYGF